MFKILFFILIMIYVLPRCYPEKIRYIATEHSIITYVNSKYIRYVNASARRYSRADPLYYVGINFEALYEFHNNVTIDLYFYEFIMNRYRKGFLEMHFQLCDLIEKDLFIGAAFRQGRFLKPCPYPAGVYNFSNVTIPIKHMPDNFPFTKGRIYASASVTASKELIGSGHIDMEIREKRNIKKK